VKAILFDKTPSMNWYVTWHQDLTIAVKEKIEVPVLRHGQLKMAYHTFSRLPKFWKTCGTTNSH